MANPLKGSLGKKTPPHPNVPGTGGSNRDDKYDISGGKAQATPKRQAIANSVSRGGRPARAGQPKQVKSKGNRNIPALS